MLIFFLQNGPRADRYKWGDKEPLKTAENKSVTGVLNPIDFWAPTYNRFFGPTQEVYVAMFSIATIGSNSKIPLYTSITKMARDVSAQLR